MRRTLTKAGQRVAQALRWLIMGAISLIVFAPLLILASGEV